MSGHPARRRPLLGLHVLSYGQPWPEVERAARLAAKLRELGLDPEAT